ncbi:MAG: P-type conjugative transfer protein VirB9, partial [Hyphomicrobiales bacterium]|nr:P-type conjugative transfer protein VirB9 [Hyphomicrobiales bacterium]
MNHHGPTMGGAVRGGRHKATCLRYDRLIAVLVAAYFASGWHPVMAEIVPHAGPIDHRIRYVTYNRNDVVQVDASYGASTMITFDKDEKVQTLALGDALAWKVEPNHAGNVLFVKPIDKHARDNLNVITNKHTYIFVLDSAFRQVNDQVFNIIFRYPDEIARAAIDKRYLAKAEKMAAEPNLHNLDVANVNSDYGVKGSSVNQPIAVFDDGTKTWFRFADSVPAIFKVDAHRNESLVNWHREGKYIIVDAVNYQWTLRNGPDVTCLFNLRRNNLNEP